MDTHRARALTPYNHQSAPGQGLAGHYSYTAQYTSTWTLSIMLVHARNLTLPQTLMTSPSFRPRTNSPDAVPGPLPCSSSSLLASSDSGSTSSSHDHVTVCSCQSFVATLFLCISRSGRAYSGWTYWCEGASSSPATGSMGGSTGRRAHRGNAGAGDLGEL